MTTEQLTLSILPDLFAICRLPPTAPLPAWTGAASFVSLTRTRDELSIVCPHSDVPADALVEGHWRCLAVEGPFALEGTIGVLAALAVPLAEAGISIFVVSTYDSDYLLLKDASLTRAIEALTRAGYRVCPPIPT